MDNETAAAQKAFLDELLAAGLLIPTGVPGLFGRSAVFEDVVDGFDRLITRSAANDRAEVWRFPPALSRTQFEKSEYMASMPQLAGTVHSFAGTPAEHGELMARIHGGDDWGAFQKLTDVVMTPAACYPLYPIIGAAGRLPAGGRLMDVYSYCFRHEPSIDPARMQLFRMRELVRIGDDPEVVRTWRNGWIERSSEILRSVGLEAVTDVANDPFFGRGGKMLAANQREQRLKFELLYPITSRTTPTAIVSCNYHQDHFGTIYGISGAAGQVAHTACVGFGMERIALALLRVHGLDPRGWPEPVRRTLWP